MSAVKDLKVNTLTVLNNLSLPYYSTQLPPSAGKGMLAYLGSTNSVVYWDGTQWVTLVAVGTSSWRYVPDLVLSTLCPNPAFPGSINPSNFVAPLPSSSTEGSTKKLMFDYNKAAIRAGNPGGTAWDDANRGFASTAFGDATVASGRSSVSIGASNHSTGHGSVALGENHVASGDYSFAGGLQNTASAQYSTALGRQNFASGAFSFSVGFGNTSSGVNSAAIGISNTASGVGSFACGAGHEVSGDYSFASGLNNGVSGTRSFATGEINGVTGGYSFASGFQNSVGGDVSGAIGYVHSVPSRGSFACGSSNTVNGDQSLAAGQNNTINAGANHSIALGQNATVNVNHNNVFMFSDGNALASIAAQEFVVGASGGTRIYSNAAHSTGVVLGAGLSAWAAVSDINRKENLVELDSQEILAKVEQLPIYEYNYKGTPADIKYRGPVAQDWHRLFPSGKPDLVIDTVDPDGITLAALKGLAAKVRALELEIQNMKK